MKHYSAFIKWSVCQLTLMLIATLVGPKLQAQDKPYANHSAYRADWQQQILRHISSKDGELKAFAILTSAGWADRGQIIVIVNKKSGILEGFHIYPGVSLQVFNSELDKTKKQSDYKSKRFKSFTAKSEELPPEFQGLAAGFSFQRAGLDHLKYLILEADYDDSKLVKYRTSFLDSPMLEKDDAEALKKIEKIFSWINSKKKDM